MIGTGARRVRAAAGDWLEGRVCTQWFWERLEALSLQGQGIGGGTSVASSGESSFLAGFVHARRSFGQPVICFVVGANVGLWSQMLLDCAGSSLGDLRVVAFEPSLEARARLDERLATHPAVTIEATAVGDRTGEAMLHADRAGSGLGSLYARRLDHFGLHMDVAEPIPVTTIDEYCEGHGIGHIDLLKLDVEGAELDVLRGAAEMLRRRRVGVIQFEFGGCNIDSRTFFQDFWYLLHESFDLYRIVKDGLWPLLTYREALERFTTTNYVAITRSR